MKLALVGASGVVGRKILQILEKKKITFEEFYPLGSTTVGEIITFHGIESVSYTHLTLPTNREV